MFDITLSSTGESVATQTTGVPLVEQRDRPVLHLARRVGVGRDVGDLLELERALEAHGQADVAAEVEEEAGVLPVLGDPAATGSSTASSSSSIRCGSSRSSATRPAGHLGLERAAHLRRA